MSNTVFPQAAGSPSALGDVLRTILPLSDKGGRGKSRLDGALHQAVYRVLGSSPHPMTPWDIKQALKRAGWATIGGGALSLVLSDGMTAGLVAFVGDGYQLRKGGRQ